MQYISWNLCRICVPIDLLKNLSVSIVRAKRIQHSTSNLFIDHCEHSRCFGQLKMKHKAPLNKVSVKKFNNIEFTSVCSEPTVVIGLTFTLPYGHWFRDHSAQYDQTNSKMSSRSRNSKRFCKFIHFRRWIWWYSYAPDYICKFRERNHDILNVLILQESEFHNSRL